MGVEFDPEKLAGVPRQKGPLPDDWKARAMAHGENIGRMNAVTYRAYLENPTAVASALAPRAASYFKYLANARVPAEYLEKHSEITAEVEAEIQDLHQEVESQNNIQVLINNAENLRKELNARKSVSPQGPIESLPPEDVNTYHQNILAAFKLSLVESRLEELGRNESEGE